MGRHSFHDQSRPLWMRPPHITRFTKPKYQKLLRYTLIATFAIFVIISLARHVCVSSHLSVQHHTFKTRDSHQFIQRDRQKAVRKEFLHAWYGYRDHAWMSDSLEPLTGTGYDQFCGWSATLIDSLDTLWIMGLTDEFEEAVNATVAIDFQETAKNCEINLFESTIRYLGGMLAAYDLSGDPRLLSKLVELGDVLYGQFNTTNGMPCNTCRVIDPEQAPPTAKTDVPLADAGSFYLEFARLSQITGNEKYANLVRFLTDVFESTQNTSSISGLWPERVDASSIHGPTATFALGNQAYSLGALSDSAYEYLVKAHLLLGGITNQYAAMWEKASDAIRRNLLFRAYIPDADRTNLLFSGLATHEYDSDDLLVEPRIQHLGCFAGGMYALSSRIFNNPTDLDIGIQLTQGCIWAYENSPTGIMPETVTLLSCPDMTGPQCAWNQSTWDEAVENITYGTNTDFPPGYLSSIDTKYLLRPEAIESVFVLYRVTGNEYYRDVGWRMFQNIIKHTRTPYGHAALHNSLYLSPTFIQRNGQPVIENRAIQIDQMESFWLAETLKYFWLLFSEPDLISLDEWVLNTEAHPLRLTNGIRAI